GARKCKTALGGVRRYQDTKDKSSTTNLKHHAIGCFGEDAINNAMKGKDASANSGSIYAAFARQGQQPVHYSHRTHTNPELLCAGRPNIELSSSDVLSRNIKVAFEKCSEHIGKLLCDHPGRLHFAMDAWTSPNHRAFVAWTVHLECEGKMFPFLLDIIEVAKVHRRPYQMFRPSSHNISYSHILVL
ncbi:uncharacterized protein EDB91DRAFT_1056620, partial [Suillus paluster]|uniref:uncharacterized protein n=1 Tax=Suillus paluster TaxID=48578 RepID=UPI001B8860CB